jgi:hypothetical protein
MMLYEHMTHNIMYVETTKGDWYWWMKGAKESA